MSAVLLMYSALDELHGADRTKEEDGGNLGQPMSHGQP